MSVIYKISCISDKITDCYVGSTSNFRMRQFNHKTCANTAKDTLLYNCINNNGGWGCWKMEVIDAIDDDNRTVLLNAEKYWINKLKPSLNKNRVLPTPQEKKEYAKIYNRRKYLENKDYYREKALEYQSKNAEWYRNYQNAYREQHRERLNKRNKEKFQCECGGRFTYVNRIQHLNTKKHLNWENQKEPALSTSPLS